VAPVSGRSTPTLNVPPPGAGAVSGAREHDIAAETVTARMITDTADRIRAPFKTR
jgi:hypothetical protein